MDLPVICLTTGSTTCITRDPWKRKNLRNEDTSGQLEKATLMNRTPHPEGWRRTNTGHDTNCCYHHERTKRSHLQIHKRSLSNWSSLWLTLITLIACLRIGVCHIRGGRRPYMDVGEWGTSPSPPAPLVDPTHSQDVVALAGKTALLNCRVHNINNKTVSWIRHRDIHLLTVGRYTYTSDQRFRGIHEDTSDDWLLKINYVQPRDSGIYECQVSTTPPLSQFIKLSVVEPKSSILGGPDMHINRGSTINLTCLVEFAPDPPDFIFWNHNDQVISYDSPRGGVTVIIEKGDVTTSTLLIQQAKMSDSGRYDCSPSNSGPANITLHVLSGEHPAAIQHGGQGTYTSSSLRNILAMLLTILATHNLMQ
ncbi:unnamed protein product [Meganyctiphanes norvegica]|uniref:Ig-like domain-containing protein n=1 Tax=Meganyctiphanes norvegica TaxID=48144 RepID=A0AAV2QFA1_MEGNR